MVPDYCAKHKPPGHLDVKNMRAPPRAAPRLPAPLRASPRLSAPLRASPRLPAPPRAAPRRAAEPPLSRGAASGCAFEGGCGLHPSFGDPASFPHIAFCAVRPAPPHPPTPSSRARTRGLTAGAGAQLPPPPPPPRTKWTLRVPHPVLIGHAASLSQLHRQPHMGYMNPRKVRDADDAARRAPRPSPPRRGPPAAAAGGAPKAPRRQRRAGGACFQKE